MVMGKKCLSNLPINEGTYSGSRQPIILGTFLLFIFFIHSLFFTLSMRVIGESINIPIDATVIVIAMSETNSLIDKTTSTQYKAEGLLAINLVLFTLVLELVRTVSVRGQT